MKVIGFFKESASHLTQTDIPDLHAEMCIANFIDSGANYCL